MGYLSTDIGGLLLNLLISAIFTVTIYGLFPILFALIRKKEIIKKKYRLFSFLVNGAILVALIILSMNPANVAPYILWTFIASNIGCTILSKKNLLLI